MKNKTLLVSGWLVLAAALVMDKILKIENVLIGGIYLIAVIIFSVLLFKKE